jgi:hypothetical protein
MVDPPFNFAPKVLIPQDFWQKFEVLFPAPGPSPCIYEENPELCQTKAISWSKQITSLRQKCQM